MQHKSMSIQKKLMRVITLVSGIVALITCLTLYLYEYYSFRERTQQNISTYAEIISRNSTAALAFESKADAEEILNALKAEPHIVLAGIYDSKGNLFCAYPSGSDVNTLPAKPGKGYHFTDASLEGFQPIVEGTKQLGTLYIKSDLKAMYSRFGLYSLIVFLILSFSLVISYLLSIVLQKGISKPILALEEVAIAVSKRKDYSVRAVKLQDDEVGSLTDAFNLMLIQIQEQTKTLTEFNQNLEEMVKDRTSELEAANKELGSFSYSVSHDLRAPIRSINGYMSIFLEDYGHLLDAEGKRLVDQVLKSGAKMGSLIDDLLAFSQLGRKELIKENTPMHELVQSAWDDLYKEDKNRSIEFILKPLPDAFAEKSTIRQALVNLISNALKYSRNKSQTVIEIAGEEKNGETVYYVKDNGSGFDMKYYDKLFGVFHRLHTQEEFEGTGVGLAIVDRIIKKHGGRIWAESKVNEGATFYFSLPRAN